METTKQNATYEVEKEEVRKEEAFFGYDEAEPIDIDQQLISLYNDIADKEEIVTALQALPHNANIKTVQKSISLWERLGIRLHEINTYENVIALADIDNESIFDEKIKLIHPRMLPVSFFNNTEGAIPENVLVQIHLDTGEKETVFHSVHISRLNNTLTSCFYNHEIAHSQMNSQFGSCKSILNSEVISLLTEEVFAYNLDPSLETTKKIRNMSLFCLAVGISSLYYGNCNDFSDEIEMSMYIKSYLEALNMANIYVNGNAKVRSQMQAYIDKIFTGERSVEDMLCQYESQYTEVPKKLELIRRVQQ